ncbi:MAG TPA: hypothetical protein VMM93_10195 [Vicinamibacterales bacterium]|nr:hypothetical protein [Vicinamibacterales bacterium]
MRARTAALVLSGWIARTLPTDPLNLFSAPIFAPERGTLACSEPTIAPALLGASPGLRVVLE